MNDVTIIDRFLDTFSRYIDSGFGLLQGEVAFLTATLIVIDMTIAGLYWAMSHATGQGDDVIAKLLRKVLCVGAFAYIIGNFNWLASIVFRSFAGLGITATGSAITMENFLQPGRLAKTGIDAAAPILEQIGDMAGFPEVFVNIDPIVVLFIAWLVVILCFFVLAVQLFITLIEFKLTTLAGFVLIPFALWNKTSFLAEKVLGNVVSSGIKVLVLAVIVGIGSGLFAEFQVHPDEPSIDHALVVMLASLALLALGIFGPGIATGLVSGAPQLGAGAMAGAAVGAVGTGVAIGAAVTGVGGAVMAGARMAPAAAKLAGAGARAATSAAGSARSAFQAGSAAAGGGAKGAAAGPQVRYADTPQPATPYQAAAQVWDDRIGSARVQAKNWRLMAFGCLVLALLMAGGLVWRSAQSIVTPYVIEVDQAGQVRAVGEAATPYRPGDAQIAHHLARFVTLVRSLSIDPIVVRQNWLDAYDYTTDKGAAVLNDYARTNDPFARIGKESVTVQITSVVRASDTSFNVRWTEQRYVNGAPAGTERWNAVLSTVLQTPRTEQRLLKNPLGIYVNGLSWSRELDSSEGAKP